MISYMKINSITICSGSFSVGSFVDDFFCPLVMSYIWNEKGCK